MNFYFYTHVSFEDWDYDNGIKKGIGGSETSIVEMAWRLAARGHKVKVYAPIKKTTKKDWRGTEWVRFEKATFKEKGIWILYRTPEAVDNFLPRKTGQQVWLLWQDWDYPTLTKKRIKGVDRHITLCKAHGRYILDRYPLVTKEQLWLSSNGIKLELIEEIEKETLNEVIQSKPGEVTQFGWVNPATIKRNPKRLMYASSPDRGLRQALISFKKAREFVPDLEFHAFYGFDNLNKLIKGQPHSHLAKIKDELVELLNQPGVHFHGRINQKDLMREWFKTGIYIYETDFFETSHISGMEAQACGAVPIFSPIFAQKENIQHGIGIEGNSEDPLTQARFAAEIVRLATQPQLQEKIRPTMMQWARERFWWENFVTQWIDEAEGEREDFEQNFVFPEQL